MQIYGILETINYYYHATYGINIEIVSTTSNMEHVNGFLSECSRPRLMHRNQGN